MHETAEATYTVFESEGKKYFQIDTYGSKDRKDKGKICQSIQLDSENAAILIKMLIDNFMK